MNEQLKSSILARARMIAGKVPGVAIFKENPIFDYFSDDERADSALLLGGEISLIGLKEVDQIFGSLDGIDYCIAPPFYGFRSGHSCSFGAGEWFQFPLSEERNFIAAQKKKIGELIDPLISDLSVNSTEYGLSQSIKNRLCSAGFSLYYEPIVAFDRNTLNVWNKPGDNNLKKIMYLEAAAKIKGLTVIYSNSFLATDEEEYVNRYRESIEGVESIKRYFVEGRTTSEVMQALEKFRGDNLYLTTPLFPFSYHAIPGPEAIIRTCDTAVFDLWIKGSEFAFRRKVIAVSGSFRASTI